MSLPPYAHWTVDTGTTEIPAARRGTPVTEQPTEALHLLDLRPPVPATRPRRRRGWFVTRADLAESWQSALTVAGGLGLALAVDALVKLTRPLGEFLAALSTGAHL